MQILINAPVDEGKRIELLNAIENSGADAKVVNDNPRIFWEKVEADDGKVYRCRRCQERFDGMTHYCPYCGSYMNSGAWPK